MLAVGGACSLDSVQGENLRGVSQPAGASTYELVCVGRVANDTLSSVLEAEPGDGKWCVPQTVQPSS